MFGNVDVSELYKDTLGWLMLDMDCTDARGDTGGREDIDWED